MKNKIISFMIIMFLVSFVSAQDPVGGGGVVVEIPCEEYCYDLGEDYYCDNITNECKSMFTDCLIENCDFFCKEKGMDTGRYYKDDKCWCEKYKKSKQGIIIIDDGWIQIKECSLEDKFILGENIDYKDSSVDKFIITSIVGCFFGFIVGRYLFPYKNEK